MRVNRACSFLAWISAAIALGWATSAVAFPDAIPFHGRLTYAAGAPYQQPIDVTVTIETSADPLDAGVAPLWGPAQYPSLPVTDGLFSIELGGGGSPAIDTAALVSASQIWMAVWINGTLMTPLYRVGAVPYAHAAHDAAALGGVLASGYATQPDVASLQDQIDALQSALAQLQGDVTSCCSGPPNPCAGQPDGTPCNDGTACTVGDACVSGTCVSGPPANCNDANVCTDDSCDAVLGCLHVLNTDPCDDDNPCTTGDVCDEGACTASPLCDDGDPCTTDTCDSGSLFCTHTGDLSAPGCTAWSTTAPYTCNRSLPPSLAPDGTLWAFGTTSTCDAGDSQNNDRAVGIDTVSGTLVNSFTVASPASQPIFRNGMITMSTDWNHNATCSGCQVQYNTSTGGIVWQGGLGPHPRGGISMSSAGTMYLAYSNIRAFNFDGSTLWNASGNSGNGAGTWIAPGGDVIGCGSSGTCRRVTSAGSNVWQVSTGCASPRMAIDAAGRAAIACPSLVRMLLPNGSELWSKTPSGNTYGPLLTSDGDMLVGTADGHLLRYSNGAGAVVADRAVCDPTEPFEPWMVTADGWVLGVCDWNDAAGIALDGSAAMRLTTTNETSWLALSSDGHLIVPDGSAIRRTTAGGWSLANTPWPTQDRNLTRTRDANTP